MIKFLVRKNCPVVGPKQIQTNTNLVGVKELWDFFLISLQLLNRVADACLLCYRALALNDYQRDSIDKDDNVRSIRFFPPLYP